MTTKTDNQELRAYFFQNMYLQGIHAGIQSQHTTVEMFIKYTLPVQCSAGKMLYDWATKHKTTIILNGGYSSNLLKIIDLLESPENPMPFGYFNETEDALGGALTNVGVIVPEKYWKVKPSDLQYSGNKVGREYLEPIMTSELYGDSTVYSEWEIAFMEVLFSCRLMN